jgi:hypothetical protein
MAHDLSSIGMGIAFAILVCVALTALFSSLIELEVRTGTKNSAHSYQERSQSFHALLQGSLCGKPHIGWNRRPSRTENQDVQEIAFSA